MKPLLPLMVAALLLPLAAPAQGQAGTGAAEPVRILDDKEGDVKLTVAGQPEDPNGRWAAADLKALDVLEGPEEFTFTLQVRDLKASPEAPVVESTTYRVSFLHKDRTFTLFLFRSVFQAASYGAYLQSYDAATGRFDQVSPFLPVQVDAGAGAMVVTVGRDLLLDRQGNAPHPEVPFTGWHAAVTTNFNVFGSRPICPAGNACVPAAGGRVEDAMPDQGNGTVDLLLRYGIVQTGRARLLSETPTRASNGEATTIVYQVRGLSRLEGNQSFTLNTAGLPPGWSVKLPAERITVPGNGSVLFPVILTVPFTHTHGTYQKFLLEMKSVRDPGSVGRIQLGIRFVQPPQPAGHHNVLWLHSEAFTNDQAAVAANTLFGGSVAGLTMNAAPPEEDPFDAKIEVQGQPSGQGAVPPVSTYRWTIPLAPALELGLDFHAGAGNVTFPVRTALPMPGTMLGGRLVYVPPQPDDGPRSFQFLEPEGLVLADVVPDAAVDVPANSQGNLLHARIVPTPETGYIPYVKGAGLRLELEVSYTGADGIGFGPNNGPVAQPGGILDLPLNEYHDKVAQVFASNTTLALEARSAQDRTTNPGKMVLYNLTLSNRADVPVAVNLELTGTHLLWVSILEPLGVPVHLEPNQTVDVRVAVKVPLEADKGDTADLVLAATSASDLNVRSLARLYTTVDTGKEYPDDAPLISGIEGSHTKKGSPGLGLPLLALGLLAALAVARRRRTA
ncbi:MAG: hypothetical protein LC623_07520 [Halobacteriales archaeon]|nr:hypothetical protein [Halobacteriales archaeon]